ncbi:MAG TPA: hypothetical protein PLG15_00800 [Candidatus Gastranaerophilaceae bacterium]|nr:hypothetical protein [Candidatus Gastranaerophilaceae bacterium]HPT40906.1 hypothetical protein [Candidatus Gastranaerophilaceae bacterium]
MYNDFTKKDDEFLTPADNSNLYAFLATNYDISDLAGKIYAQNYSKLNIISLRKASSLAV